MKTYNVENYRDRYIKYYLLKEMEKKDMKTIVIYNPTESPVQFFVVKGDYTHLHRVDINSGVDEEKEKEVVQLIYDEDHDWNLKVEFLDEFPVDQYNPKEDKVIVIGFLD